MHLMHKCTMRWKCYGYRTVITPITVSFSLAPQLYTHGFPTIHLITVWKCLGSKSGLCPWRLFFSSSLYTALFWPLLIKEAESFDFWILHSLTFAVDKWKCHSQVAWKCVAEEKVPLSGRHLDMPASDICLEIKVQQPTAAKLSPVTALQPILPLLCPSCYTQTSPSL